MQHRDKIILQKIVEEIDMGTKLLGDASLDAFLQDEMQKRAIGIRRFAWKMCIKLCEMSFLGFGSRWFRF